MIMSLGSTHGVGLGASTMVGDQEIDASAARAAGVGHFVYAAEFFGWK
jgi:phosphoglycolate phosphatase-like HAD superfamily hydrolase